MKKFFYIITWGFLGLFISFILHAVIEMFYLRQAEASNLLVNWTHGCALPYYLNILLIVLGIVGGILIGYLFWHKHYFLKNGKNQSRYLRILVFTLMLVTLVALVWSLNYYYVLKHENKVQPTATPRSTSISPTPASSCSTCSSAKTPTSEAVIPVQGDEACIQNVEDALNLLKNQAPTHYQAAIKYIGLVECLEKGSGMFVWETPPRYGAGQATIEAGTLWFASTFPHEACHSKEYLEGREYLGEQAEAECLQAQYDALIDMKAPQSTLDHVKNSLSTKYWEIDYEDRWW